MGASTPGTDATEQGHVPGPPASRAALDREVVVAIVGPIGSPVDAAVEALQHGFADHGYRTEVVRISTLIDTAVPGRPEDEGHSPFRRLMEKGDRFRSGLQDEAACAYLAVQAVNRRRVLETGSAKRHRPRFATIVRSLKTPAEVSLLRSVYGQRCVVVGVSASDDQRLRELTGQLVRKGLDKADAAAEAAYLLQRDDKDEKSRYGQRMRDAYRLADAFLPARTGQDDAHAQRLVGLLLGEPWQTPTRDEQGMFQAWAAKFRSSASGRQVGAAVADDLGEVVVLGCNDVPRPGGGQYWPGEPDDQRDFQHKRDANDRGKYNSVVEVLRELAQAGWLAQDVTVMDADERARRALESGPLSATRLSDLIEFGRIVHAEMAALTTAAREGRGVRGGTLYTTTYPCHECARLVIASGIARVVFIDPYQKSLAPDLYADMWDGSGAAGRVRVEPFVGVSPRLFTRVFEMSNRTKELDGTYAPWSHKVLVTEDQEVADSVPLNEQAAGDYFAVLLARQQGDRTARLQPAEPATDKQPQAVQGVPADRVEGGPGKAGVMAAAARRWFLR